MREHYTARLRNKLLLSAAAQCYQLEFTLESERPPAIEAGQFLSLLVDDPAGKTYTRAYSIASAPREAQFDLCVNRVQDGFFSNLLCDLNVGQAITCHGPHGLFTLRQPLVDSLMIAAGTGIAPMRGFIQWLFPAGGPDRSEGRACWLLYEAPQQEELFYDDYFLAIAAAHPNFHYVPVLSPEGLRTPFAAAIAHVSSEMQPGLEDEGDHGSAPPEALVRETLKSTAAAAMQPGSGPGEPVSHGPTSPFSAYAYVCGLGEMVSAARAQLLDIGWQRRQVLFERYD